MGWDNSSLLESAIKKINHNSNIGHSVHKEANDSHVMAHAPQKFPDCSLLHDDTHPRKKFNISLCPENDARSIN